MRAAVSSLSRGVVLAAIAATLVVFLVIDGRSHSVSDTLYGMVVPEAVVLAAAAAALVAVRLIVRGRA